MKATRGPQGIDAAIILSATAIPPPQEQRGVETATLVAATIEVLRYFWSQRLIRSPLTYRLIADEMSTLNNRYGQISRNISHTCSNEFNRMFMDTPYEKREQALHAYSPLDTTFYFPSPQQPQPIGQPHPQGHCSS